MSLKIDVLLIQIVNVLILFWIFKKFIGDTLTREITERQSLIKKLEAADEEYEKRIAEAEKKAAAIFAHAKEEKKNLIQEGKELWEKRQQEAIEAATLEANKIRKDAEEKASKTEADLEKNFESSVKQTAFMVIKKLFNEKKDLQEEYVTKLIQEVKK